jgi:hypothetical protein
MELTEWTKNGKVYQITIGYAHYSMLPSNGVWFIFRNGDFVAHVMTVEDGKKYVDLLHS